VSTTPVLPRYSCRGSTPLPVLRTPQQSLFLRAQRSSTCETPGNITTSRHQGALHTSTLYAAVRAEKAVTFFCIHFHHLSSSGRTAHIYTLCCCACRKGGDILLYTLSSLSTRWAHIAHLHFILRCVQKRRRHSFVYTSFHHFPPGGRT